MGSTSTVSNGTCIIYVIIAIILTIFFLYVYIRNKIKSYVSSLSDAVMGLNDSFCTEGASFLDYKKNSGYLALNVTSSRPYSKDFAEFLYRLCYNVSNLNCIDNLGDTLPPEFPLPDDFELQKILRIPGGNSTVYGCSFIDTLTDTLYFVWSGTSDLKMTEEDINALPEPLPADMLSGVGINTGEQNLKFHKGYLSVYEKLRGSVQGLWSTGRGATVTPYTYTPDRIVICGHSMGGALSYINAFDVLTNSPSFKESDVIIYTFGSPRCGNVDFSEYFDSLQVLSNVRIFNTEDIIPTIPPATSGTGANYQHIGTCIPFTINKKSIIKNHVEAYKDYLPKEII